MYLAGLDELDQKILGLLTENARYTYSEIGDRLGVSRVSVKNHMDELEKNGIIEGYTVIINPQQLTGAISCYYEIESEPSTFREVIDILTACETVTQIYRITGSCTLHVHAVAADQKELEAFTETCLDRLPGIRRISTSVILQRLKDVKGLRL